MKSRAPQLHLEYRFYKVLGNSGGYSSKCLWEIQITQVKRKWERTGNEDIELYISKFGGITGLKTDHKLAYIPAIWAVYVGERCLFSSYFLNSIYLIAGNTNEGEYAKLPVWLFGQRIYFSVKTKNCSNYQWSIANSGE